MSARPYAAVLFVTAVASLAALWDLLAAITVVAGGAGLLWGLYREDATAATAASWILYVPIAFALGLAVPSIWNFVAAGLFVIAVSEMMTFELQFSAALYSTRGVDVEAKSLARLVSKAHAKELGWYFAVVLPVMAVSAALSNVTQSASELFAGAILLFLVLLVYARR